MRMNSLGFLLALMAPSTWAYSIDDYVRDSSQRDPSLKAVTYESESAELALRLPEKVTAIQLFADTSFFDDGRPVLLPDFQGKRNTLFNFDVGVKQQTPWGINWTLSQNFQKTKYLGVIPGTIPQTDFYDFFPSASVNIPLWQNFLGSQVRAQRDLLKANSEMQNVQAQIQKEQKLADIEESFYQYGIQQNLYDLAQKNLDRTEKLYTWISQRRRQNLVDDSDEMQTKASLALRRLEFDKAESDLRVSRSDFNGYRNMAADEPVSALDFTLLDPATLRQLAQTRKVAFAEKVKELQAEGQKQQARVNVQAASPKLDFNGTFIFQGRDTTFDNSEHDMFLERRNYWNIGLSFQMPLDVGLNIDLKHAADLYEKGADERIKRSTTDKELSWINEQETLVRCAQSLELVRDLEAAQKARFSDEEKKYRNGRSTLFLVLTAEQDFINAQTQKWASELQCRKAKAQSRLFYEET